MSEYQRERFPIPTPKRLKKELRLRKAPRWLVWSLIALFLPSGVMLALIYRARQSTSTKPRVHVFMDMDIQPRYGPQAASNLFADGKAMRGPIAGTIARGKLEDRPHYDLGYRTETDAKGQAALVFFRGLPDELKDDNQLLARGENRFAIYCAACHGVAGDGHGPVNELAVKNKEPKWVPAASLLSAQVRSQADGQLYNTIRNGVKNMPAHGAQINTYDRWTIVAHVRQLQQTQPATQPATRPTGE